MIMKIKDLPKHLRPREKLIEKSESALTNSELLAILFRTGTTKKNAIELAEYILHKYPMKKLVELDYDTLVEIDGIDAGKACTLLASFELVKRALQKHDTHLPMINSPQDAVDQLTEIRSKKKEYFVALYLNARNQLIHKETISIGTLNASLVHPRDVFEPGVRMNAASIIISHNHPSGDPKPSDPDIRITKQLKEAGEILGIQLQDHLIVTEETYLSMKEEGCL
ncbi:hypothetical protein CO051_00935 [Candidatus Roizmanbacteria bacterium CG_4_9_14_0_2_um_filter_39_13]|uniref:MPN domain-containing protein n=2 Tax=Candidatus Roizmaniibacteriota TaxID=1752723 RepID=A0A2M8F3K0_9BACT|nr:MAG: hypothetical protein COY15_05230 [Candidatus Roizmanbacteria bacterium CG_4_10_14_0_2_um_filter_39_12]PJC33855.1 MAG: hypothetical protein CO051_00935 [Candidatus Roizmanbacteria bacterium CG_4_9_14_0_2_um_filter_39_13]PJE61733.1 MAG: hypothetical protein COU87_03065 [Candidatus Roizmanbacteria bacterium CG10_big_fil_rev_8_21_14_0_10_39_12]